MRKRPWNYVIFLFFFFLFLLIVSVLIDVSGVISHFFSSLYFHSLIFSWLGDANYIGKLPPFIDAVRELESDAFP
jgi:hypothetical protein